MPHPPLFLSLERAREKAKENKSGEQQWKVCQRACTRGWEGTGGGEATRSSMGLVGGEGRGWSCWARLGGGGSGGSRPRRSFGAWEGLRPRSSCGGFETGTSTWCCDWLVPGRSRLESPEDTVGPLTMGLVGSGGAHPRSTMRRWSSRSTRMSWCRRASRCSRTWLIRTVLFFFFFCGMNNQTVI